MMIQQNAITSTRPPVAAKKARVRNGNAILAILLILGVTLMLGLYVYQASVLYTTQLAIQDKEQEYARHQRLNAEALILLAQTQSMASMVNRAESSGYRPPSAKQIRYVRIDDGVSAFIPGHEVATETR